MVQLGTALEVNSGLEMLLVADNPFGDEGGQQLTSVLCRSNCSLRVLDLHGTHMSKAVEREVCGQLYMPRTKSGCYIYRTVYSTYNYNYTANA